MDENPTIWLPAPAAPQAIKPTQTEVAVCPSCGRRLLTRTSALCNWCGAKIDNPDYQARAAQTRAERDHQERAALEAPSRKKPSTAF